MNKNHHVATALCEFLADTYALYLKTQNFHWNVEGPNFPALHKLFEAQYEELADAVDSIAERIRAIGEKAPAAFSIYQKTTHIKEGNVNASAEEMIQALAHDHTHLSEQAKKVRSIAEEVSDIGTVSFTEDRIRAHEKTAWMLNASLE
jgi:starvation-inducible DNA-binding protein